MTEEQINSLLTKLDIIATALQSLVPHIPSFNPEEYTALAEQHKLQSMEYEKRLFEQVGSETINQWKLGVKTWEPKLPPP